MSWHTTQYSRNDVKVVYMPLKGSITAHPPESIRFFVSVVVKLVDSSIRCGICALSFGQAVFGQSIDIWVVLPDVLDMLGVEIED